MNRNTQPLHIQFGGWLAALSIDDAPTRKRLEAYFEPFVLQGPSIGVPNVLIHAGAGLVPPPSVDLKPWDARGKDSYGDHRGERIILKNRTGVMIAGRDGIWRFSGDIRRNFAQLVNLMGTLYGISVLNRGAAMIHASAAIRDGKAIAIVGESGTGKSSVMVRLLERGFDFLTNDRVLVMPSSPVAAYGLPKLPRVNPGTLLAGQQTRLLLGPSQLKRYRRLSQEELWGLEDKHDLDVRETLGRSWFLKAPLVAAVVLTRHGAGPFDIEPLDAGQSVDALRAVEKSFGAFDARLGNRTNAALVHMADHVPMFRVTSKADPDVLAERIARGNLQELASTGPSVPGHVASEAG